MSFSDSHTYISVAPENVYDRLIPVRRPVQAAAAAAATTTTRRLSTKPVLVICVVISIAAVCLCSVVLVRDAIRDSRHSGSIDWCVPCHAIVSTPVLDGDTDVNTLQVTVREGRAVCCARTSEQLLTMINMIYERRSKFFQPKVDRLVGSARPGLTSSGGNLPAAHVLAGLSKRYRPPGDDKRYVKSWITDHSDSYLRGVILYKDRLLITEEGLYYVYSQMYFKILTDNGVALPNLLGHQVVRYNTDDPNDGKQIVLQTVHTCQPNNRGVYIHTSFVGGVFHLRQNDQLYVIVSNSSLIDRDPKLSFFGIFKLGG